MKSGNFLGYYFCETHFGLGKTNLRFSQYFQGGEMEMSRMGLV